MQLDMNLLVALDALLEEGSVAGAAQRLHLTAPAMSRALGRIRRAMDDQILVRTGRTMTPTPRALAVRERVHALVQQAQVVLAPERDIDLTTLDRTFTLTCHDTIATAIGPALLASVGAQAPGVRLRLLAEASVDTSDLRHGRVDLEIASGPPASPDISHDTVLHDRLAVVVRDDHPAVEAGLSLERYTAGEHIIVSRRGRLRDPIDELLRARGLERRVVAAVATATAAFHTIRHGELFVTVPERMTRPVLDTLPLRALELPLEHIPIPATMAWHQRYDGDRAHAWLRARVRAALNAT
ncbi:LysR family transcriptional regulator [Pseudonocardia acaciae]|uniref:LysR family transcriptional regulator n=1 Tax=Pseudonocardia acaciae TaxID=551276 RepID=UPI00048B1171|nr:LysR family transcriptional regulator [Pseudonocardia acaciae]